jgi:hypothetical protein
MTEHGAAVVGAGFIYHGPLCVEVEDRHYEGSPQLRREALVKSLTYLRSLDLAGGHTG